MWFLFAVVPMATALASTVFKAAGGGRLVTVGVSAMVWQLNKGYKAGEGQLTDRANGGKYYGIEPNLDSTYDLNQGLGVLAGTLEEDFKPFVGKKFDMTVSEAQLLRDMVVPAVDVIKQSRAIGMLLREHPDNPEVQEMASQSFEHLKKVTAPVLTYLRQFPKARTKV